MTRMEAMEYVEDRELVVAGVCLGAGYIQCELQYIWDHTTHEPINGIRSLGFSRGEAQMLWNARKNIDQRYKDFLADPRNKLSSRLVAP